MTEYQQQSVPQDLAARVRKTFDDVRHRDLSGLSDLQTAGSAIVPFLALFLSDPDEVVRREAVSLLCVVAGKEALPLIILALNDSSAEIRDRAAMGLYERYERSAIADHESLGNALVPLIVMESPSAAALLLSAYFPTEEVEDALRTALKRKEVVDVKLFAHSTPVPFLLPVQVALAHHGSAEAQSALVRTIESASVAEAEFLLDAIHEADSSSVLRAMAKFLADPRQSTTQVHSAPVIQLRVCDLAVNAFIKRLELKVTFKHSVLQKYEVHHVDEVRRLVAKAVPDRPIPELAKPQ